MKAFIPSLLLRRKVYFDVSGAIKIGKGDYEVTISRDRSTSKYNLKASFTAFLPSRFLDAFAPYSFPAPPFQTSNAH